MSVIKTAGEAKRRLRGFARPTRAKALTQFFQCHPGGYGDPTDCFLGCTVPESRIVTREAARMPIDEVENLLSSKWHEERLVAVMILVDKMTRSLKASDEFVESPAIIYKSYLRCRGRVNNWDLVDASVRDVAGAYLFHRTERRKAMKTLRNWADHKTLWVRRMAMVATFYFIQRDVFEPTLEIAKALVRDEEDLIHKASGWMLREMGKRDSKSLHRFLKKHAGHMPRTMLRYSIERLSALHRKRYMAMKS